ncbi:MAG TPA: saccharopine dehydrogenase NADP-binding domain-containing protein, partial [Aestuariivirga sp.]|nr:saccharopine dehydrogenase NADP-binding domain-containing protein [Aestuariivirga sp.]
MNKWPVHATWNGPIVMIGFGSIGRGSLPLILRHIAFDKSKMTVIDPSSTWSHLVEKEGIAFLKQEITKQNYKSILTPLLTAGPGQALIVNLTVDVGSIDIIKLARETNSLCIDTVNEPWPGFYFNTKLDNADRTNYKVREDLLEVKRKLGPGPTAVSCCGANPGMVSWFVKQALLNLARDMNVAIKEPATREGWAKLMKRLGVKGIHIAERDTQRSKNPKPLDVFINTWSVDGFISEGLQPAEQPFGLGQIELVVVFHPAWRDQPGQDQGKGLVGARGGGAQDQRR